ncbi:FecR domain-containing protein, partial [Aerosakkonemataceae cyanobacterium BLCC-F50]
MSQKLILLVGVILWGIIAFSLPKAVRAQTPLTRAIVESIRNLVRLIPQNQGGRPARIYDRVSPGDSLATGPESLAELRFDDGSLARIGQQAVFLFLPNTRTFRLNNGTMLLLIPPGRGETRVRTPNARAGIRGSALFVRYIPDTNTTIVGALTDSNIEVFNQSGSQREGLRAGQLAVIEKDRITGIYDFDLKTFYETSELTRGLNLTELTNQVATDPARTQVQAETSTALAAQPPITGKGILETPAFVRLRTNISNPYQVVLRCAASGVAGKQESRAVDESFQLQISFSPAASSGNTSNCDLSLAFDESKIILPQPNPPLPNNSPIDRNPLESFPPVEAGEVLFNQSPPAPPPPAPPPPAPPVEPPPPPAPPPPAPPPPAPPPPAPPPPAPPPPLPPPPAPPPPLPPPPAPPPPAPPPPEPPPPAPPPPQPPPPAPPPPAPPPPAPPPPAPPPPAPPIEPPPPAPP